MSDLLQHDNDGVWNSSTWRPVACLKPVLGSSVPCGNSCPMAHVPLDSLLESTSCAYPLMQHLFTHHASILQVSREVPRAPNLEKIEIHPPCSPLGPRQFAAAVIGRLQDEYRLKRKTMITASSNPCLSVEADGGREARGGLPFRCEGRRGGDGQPRRRRPG